MKRTRIVRSRRARQRARKGFSLIEVMVAMTVLSIVLLNLAKVTTALALRGRNNDLLAKRAASLQLEANKFGATSYANLAGWSTTDQTVTRGNFTYTRHLVLSRVSPTRYSVKIVITPAADATKKDSVMLDRTLPSSGSPLCQGC